LRRRRPDFQKVSRGAGGWGGYFSGGEAKIAALPDTTRPPRARSGGFRLRDGSSAVVHGRGEALAGELRRSILARIGTHGEPGGNMLAVKTPIMTLNRLG